MTKLNTKHYTAPKTDPTSPSPTYQRVHLFCDTCGLEPEATEGVFDGDHHMVVLGNAHNEHCGTFHYFVKRKTK